MTFREEQFSRTALLVGNDGLDSLAGARVAVFGVGGVGGYVCEALARSGVGTLDIIDSDTVSISNLNRQIIATVSSIGKYKVDVMKERIMDINPEAVVNAHRCFYVPETSDQFDFTQYDYVIDAVDTVAAKLSIIEECIKNDVPVISSMGAGNKMHPELFELADISKTSVCPLAKVMRRELKKRGINHLKVVYSKEIPIRAKTRAEGPQPELVPLTRETAQQITSPAPKRSTPGSIAFVPSAVGLIIAGEVVRNLTGYTD